MNLSNRVLKAFVELAECRHFTRAAERCHLSQSAFSQLIQRLEQDAGVPMFQRTTRNVTLTAEGLLFLERARRLLADMETSLADLKDHASYRKGRVAVAALPSLAADVVPRAFALFHRRYPAITLEMFDRLSDACLELVRQERVDFALTAPGPRLAEFECRQLRSEPFYLVCHPGHPLGRRRRVTLKDLAGCEFVHLARSSSVRQHLDALTASAGVLESTIEIEHLATLAALIANGFGVSLVPELTLFQFKRPDLVVIPVDAPSLRRPLLLVQRKGAALSRAAAELLAILEPMLAASPARTVARRASPRRPSAIV
jgi:LysR family carnitine catabolism transcriptional activator